MSESGAGALLGGLFGTAEMRALFSDRARVQAMLDFEAALARAEARCGVIPVSAAEAIAAQCRADFYEFGALAVAVESAGNLAIPLVRELTRRVACEAPAAAGYVHWGATSQDVIDTGTVLQLRAALSAIERDCLALQDGARQIARVHAGTAMPGRTWLQQAVPVTLGLKAAGWVDALARHRVRLGNLRPQLVLQFGGAAGTLAALADHAPEVSALLGDELGLPVPAIPWHTHRDRLAEFATTLGLLVGTLGKMARDLVLLMQTEVGEAAEPHAQGRGGSSTMPHKQNPVAGAAVLAAAQRVPGLVAVMLGAMVQEHERGIGGWHAEWETLPEICQLCGGALHHLGPVLAGLEVSPERMRANLAMQGGLNLAEAVSMALAGPLGRADAHALVEACCERALASRRDLASVLADDARVRAHLDGEQIARLLDPEHYLGQSGAMIDAVVGPGNRPASARRGGRHAED